VGTKGGKVMDPSFVCAFCGREVRCMDDEASVTVLGSLFFRRTDTFLSINGEKFCTLKCLLAYITHWYAWEQLETNGD